jgi:ATP-binding cassette subfamily B protein
VIPSTFVLVDAVLPISNHTISEYLLSGSRRPALTDRHRLRDAPALILDEPTTGLDPAGARWLIGLLGKAMAGRTTILITHDLALATAADYVVTLGSRAQSGPSAERQITNPALDVAWHIPPPAKTRNRSSAASTM